MVFSFMYSTKVGILVSCSVFPRYRIAMLCCVICCSSVSFNFTVGSRGGRVTSLVVLPRPELHAGRVELLAERQQPLQTRFVCLPPCRRAPPARVCIMLRTPDASPCISLPAAVYHLAGVRDDSAIT